VSSFKKPYELKESISIVDYAVFLGYKIDKSRSTSSWIKMENSGTGDKVLIGIKKGREKEDLFKSLVDEENDKGDIIQFCQNRLNLGVHRDKSKEGFYNSLVELNKFLGIYLKPEYRAKRKATSDFIEKKRELAQSQNEDFNRIPISDYSYFIKDRMLDMATLQHPLFKDRLFNSFFVTKNKHVITNFAFGKYKNGELVGLEVRNKNLKSIVEDHEGIFISNTDGMKSIDYVFYCESGIDVLSYFELLTKNVNYNPDKNYCFISTGGFVYEPKMKVIMDTLNALPISESTKFVSITDNDGKGFYYDMKFTARLISEYYTPVIFETVQKNFNVFHFTDKAFLEDNQKHLKSMAKHYNIEVDSMFDAKERYGHYMVIKKTQSGLSVYFPMNFNPSESHFKDFLERIGAKRFYVPHKAKAKDWNDALKKFKTRRVRNSNETSVTKKKRTIRL